MIKRILFAAMLLVAFAGSAFAQTEGLGIGVMIGEPSGLSVKYWLDKSTAIDGGAAWSMNNDRGFQIHADYLIHKFDLIAVSGGSAPVYYGIGGRLTSGNNNHDGRLGVRIPIGVAYIPSSIPFDFFVELAPIVDLIPETSAEINLSIGARFYFKGVK